MLLDNLISKALENPRKLFLLDGLGAILSAILIGMVLVKFEGFIGIPVSTLYFLARIPIFFAIYDFYSYRQPSQKTGPLLQGIALLNLGYCLVSAGLLFHHLETITLIGWGYFLIEILIVLSLAWVEFRVGKRIKKAIK